jgi:hypothetical protein
METMILTLATAAQTSPGDTWKAELKRILVTVALSLTFLGVSAL